MRTITKGAQPQELIAQQCLPAYCIAIAQAALRYAEREEKRAARMKKKGGANAEK